MGSTLDRVPAHLRGVVVHQDYSRYTEIDQAVWRFVLLQMFARLRRTAHSAYAHGLHDTGMSVERIPSVAEMDAALSRYGWGAVCVDGFIPPRAFVEFQALGILPIAAEIRTAEHLPYTPAPDIIHEAAGHAPLLVDREYAAFLQRIGRVGTRAFSSPEDRKVYDAIYLVSEVKEDAASTAEQVRRAEQRLRAALASVSYISEAARVARLYWWTAEYGLVGTTKDYRLYGAGLLSSLAESHFCHDPSVHKLALTAECVETDYDITRPQPQLFVARDFAHAGEVLDEVATTFAENLGGIPALTEAKRSAELCTVELDSGLRLVGRLTDFTVDDDRATTVTLSGPCAVATDHGVLEGWGPRTLDLPYLVFCAGPLADGRSLAEFAETDVVRATTDGTFEVRLASGIRITGRPRRPLRDSHGRLRVLGLDRCEIWLGDTRLFDSGAQPYPLLAGNAFRTVFAGSADPSFFQPDAYSSVTVPKPRAVDEPTRELLGLYEEALRIWRLRGGTEIVDAFHTVHRRLVTEFPDEWLLRWNLLESLRKVGEKRLDRELREELGALEIRYAHNQPIAMGLRYLSERFDGGEGDD